MELIPRQPDEENLEEKYPGLNLLLSDLANGARSLVPRRQSNKALLTKIVNESFELLGGVPRFTIWADQNYGDYVKFVGRLVPAMAAQVAAAVPVKIISAIPPSPLDGEWTEGEYTETSNGQEDPNGSSSGR